MEATIVMTLAELRAAFTRAPIGARVATDPCPPWGALLQAVHGGLSRVDTDRVVDHTSGCPACARAWRLAARLPTPPAPHCLPASEEG